MKILKYYSIIILLLTAFSCNVKPEAINYGSNGSLLQNDHHNKVHAAEIVTKKGKVYKFDATECIIQVYEGI